MLKTFGEETKLFSRVSEVYLLKQNCISKEKMQFLPGYQAIN